MRTNTLLLRSLMGLLFFFMLLSSPACTGVGIDGEGEYVRQNRTAAGFSRIDLALSGKVEVRQGAQFAMVVEAQGNLQDMIETKVDGSKLVITCKKNIGNAKELHFYITMPGLEGIEVSGSGNVEVKDIFSPEKLELEVSGSGHIRGNFIAGKVEADVSGSGSITIDGSAERLKGDISGSGKLNAVGLAAKSADLDIAGSGDITASVSDEMEVDIAGSGSVKYKGKPGKIKQNIAGSGRVVQM